VVSVTVVKCGGAALDRRAFDLEQLRAARRTLVVHGAGPRISTALASAGIVSRFVGGRRVTTRDALPHVRAAFAAANRELCAQLGPRAVGLLGDELGLRAERLPELGEAGTPLPHVPRLLWELLDVDALPVVAPLARGPLNVNADDAAAVLAIALEAECLVFHSDVPGVLVDGEVLSSLSAAEIPALNGSLTGGVVPKLEAAVLAARAGVRVELGATLVTA
jgi:acetylglutamate kinase